ncbi:ribosomal RNA large subunit methyltransferase J, partial [Gorgonomyces haynaldii]
SKAQWLLRQQKDRFVKERIQQGYRSRASLKLLEMDSKFKLFKNNQSVLDLGCSPGGWLQVARQKTNGKCVGIDLVECEPIEGCTILRGDMNQMTFDQFDIILSDMHHPSTGNRSLDRDRVDHLVDMAFEMTRRYLKPGGHFVVKSLNPRQDYNSSFKEHFIFKPPQSRKNSQELYLIFKDKISA